MTTDDSLVDVVASGVDAGVRLSEMIPPDMVAVRLTASFRAILVAAPDCLETRGEPKTIADLSNHNCIGFRMLASGGVYAWEVQDNGVEIAADVRVTNASQEMIGENISLESVFEQFRAVSPARISQRGGS